MLWVYDEQKYKRKKHEGLFDELENARNFQILNICILIKLKTGADTGFKWGRARFISEQKNPDLGTKRRDAGKNIVKIDIFCLFCNRLSLRYWEATL